MICMLFFLLFIYFGHFLDVTTSNTRAYSIMEPARMAGHDFDQNDFSFFL